MPIRLTAIALAMLTSSATAQQPPTLTRLEPGTCPGCTISLEKVAVIGKATDAELLPEFGRLIPLADGGFAAAGGDGSTLMLRYDATGRYLGTIGRLGDGPGEYRSAQSVVRARGDSLSIMGRRRITTISLATGKGRTEPSNLQNFYHTVLGDGRVVVNSMAEKEPMFALLAPGSTVLSRFGPVPPPVVLPRQGGRTIGDPYATWVALVPSPTSGIWTAAVYYSHHLQKLTVDGAVVKDIRRSPRWFAPYSYDAIDEKIYRLGELRTPRPSTMNGIGIDAMGNLLTLSRVADAKWKADPNVPPPHPPGGEYPVEKLEPTGGIDRYVDSVLELYREADGTFLGSWRSDTLLGQMMPNGLLYLKHQDADGVVSYTVYRVKVTGAR